jgi:hypothetical protein
MKNKKDLLESVLLCLKYSGQCPVGG